MTTVSNEFAGVKCLQRRVAFGSKSSVCEYVVAFGCVDPANYERMRATAAALLEDIPSGRTTVLQFGRNVIAGDAADPKAWTQSAPMQVVDDGFGFTDLFMTLQTLVSTNAYEICILADSKESRLHYHELETAVRKFESAVVHLPVRICTVDFAGDAFLMNRLSTFGVGGCYVDASAHDNITSIIKFTQANMPAAVFVELQGDMHRMTILPWPFQRYGIACMFVGAGIELVDEHVFLQTGDVKFVHGQTSLRLNTEAAARKALHAQTWVKSSILVLFQHENNNRTRYHGLLTDTVHEVDRFVEELVHYDISNIERLLEPVILHIHGNTVRLLNSFKKILLDRLAIDKPIGMPAMRVLFDVLSQACFVPNEFYNNHECMTKIQPCVRWTEPPQLELSQSSAAKHIANGDVLVAVMSDGQLTLSSFDRFESGDGLECDTIDNYATCLPLIVGHEHHDALVTARCTLDKTAAFFTDAVSACVSNMELSDVELDLFKAIVATAQSCDDAVKSHDIAHPANISRTSCDIKVAVGCVMIEQYSAPASIVALSVVFLRLYEESMRRIIQRDLPSWTRICDAFVSGMTTAERLEPTNIDRAIIAERISLDPIVDCVNAAVAESRFVLEAFYYITGAPLRPSLDALRYKAIVLQACLLDNIVPAIKRCFVPRAVDPALLGDYKHCGFECATHKEDCDHSECRRCYVDFCVGGSVRPVYWLVEQALHINSQRCLPAELRADAFAKADNIKHAAVALRGANYGSEMHIYIAAMQRVKQPIELRLEKIQFLVGEHADYNTSDYVDDFAAFTRMTGGIWKMKSHTQRRLMGL